MGLQIQTALLVFIRITTFMTISPGFSIKGLPNLIKVGLAAGIAFAAIPVVPVLSAEIPMLLFVLLGINEVF